MSTNEATSMETRRSFIRLTSASFGALLIGRGGRARAQAAPPLIVQLEAICRRLAPLGWQSMMLAVTGGGLDVTAPDLAHELAKPLSIDRSYPGFGDFALAGERGIEPGRPDESLLYHAFAAPTVVSDPAGRMLGDFPTVAELDIIENYIYAARAATLDTLHAATNGLPAAIATFALHYRNAPDLVSGKHAQLCFSRTGVVRIGDLEPFYDAPRRSFADLDSGPSIQLSRCTDPVRSVCRSPDAGWRAGIRPPGSTGQRCRTGVLGSTAQAIQRARMHRGARSTGRTQQRIEERPTRFVSPLSGISGLSEQLLRRRVKGLSVHDRELAHRGTFVPQRLRPGGARSSSGALHPAGDVSWTAFNVSS